MKLGGLHRLRYPEGVALHDAYTQHAQQLLCALSGTGDAKSIEEITSRLRAAGEWLVRRLSSERCALTLIGVAPVLWAHV